MQRHAQEGNGESGVLLTREQVGDRLGVSPRTVARLVTRGELPVVRIGRLARFRGVDVAALIEAGLEQEKAPAATGAPSQPITQEGDSNGVYPQ